MEEVDGVSVGRNDMLTMRSKNKPGFPTKSIARRTVPKTSRDS